MLDTTRKSNVSLITINADLTRACDLLERIAVAVERYVGPEVKEGAKPEIRRTQPQDIGRVNIEEGIAMAKLKEFERMYGRK